jgi:signal transduction histidine kinase
LITAIPVHTLSSRGGALELAESLAPAHAYLRTTITNLVLSLVAVIAVCSLIMLLSSVVLVGRPIGVLVERARSIGAGNLSDRLKLAQNDEIGELAAEMDAMCERLAAARDDLDKETAARIRTLEQLRHADRLTTVGRLAAGIAHELGTPLNVVSGRAKMLARPGVTPEQTQEYARIVSEQADRMAGIIRQLLDFARRREPRRQRHDLRAVASQTVSLLEPLARKRGVRVALTEGPSTHASVDAGQLQQALTNLVVNAVHVSPEQSTVEVSVTRGVAKPPEGGEREVAVIKVVDQGSGIPPEVRDQIFDPFFTTKPVGAGTGLGLSVTRDIVIEHGGWITVDTAPGAGTTFGIHLPLNEEP